MENNPTKGNGVDPIEEKLDQILELLQEVNERLIELEITANSGFDFSIPDS